MAVAPQKCVLEQNFQLPTPSPKVWFVCFLTVDRNGKLLSAIMETGCSFPITDAPKVWFFSFLSVNGNGKLVSAIMETGKNDCNSPITDPPKVWFFSFLSVGRNGKLLLVVMETGKIGRSSTKTCSIAKLPITLLAFIALLAAESSIQKCIHNAIVFIDTSNNALYNQLHWLVGTPYLAIKASNADPPKVWVSGFSSVNRNGKLVMVIMENGKNGCSSTKTCSRAKLQITNPPKVWVASLLCVDGYGKLASAIMENWKNGCVSQKMCSRAKLPITNPPKVWFFGFDK